MTRPSRLTASLVVACTLATGCASLPKATATAIVAASDSTADTLAASWAAGTEARIAECRALDLIIVAERVACLGKFQPNEIDKVIAAVQVLVLVQLAVKEAAECEELKTCVGEVDWVGLAAQAREAWAALKPYVEALQQGTP